MSDVTQPQAFSRMDQSFLGAWWWTVDRTLLACVLSLMLFGVALVASASPAVAEKIGVGDYHFLKKHINFDLDRCVYGYAAPSLAYGQLDFNRRGDVDVFGVIFWG
mgnify:CR=1 FL=1